MKFSDINGKTIESATQAKLPGYDDDGWLLMKFTDGTQVVIIACYGDYTGESEEEYPTGIAIRESDGERYVVVDDEV